MSLSHCSLLLITTTQRHNNNKSFLFSSSSLSLLLLLLLSSLAIFLSSSSNYFTLAQTPTATTTYNVRASTILNGCKGCITYELVQGHGAWDTTLCSNSSVYDSYTGLTTYGELAIIRSAESESAATTMLNGRGDAMFGGSDLETQQIWKWNATGEVFFDNRTWTNPKFAYQAFDHGWFDTNFSAKYPVYEWRYFEPKTGGSVLDVVDGEWVAKSVTNRSNRFAVCTYHHPVVAPLFHKNRSTIAEEEEFFNVADFQIFAEHVTHERAFEKCRAVERNDPNFVRDPADAMYSDVGFETPDQYLSVNGELAYFLFDNESETVADLLRPPDEHVTDFVVSQKLSDVRFHAPNETDFGVWLGGNVTAVSANPSNIPPTIFWSVGDNNEDPADYKLLDSTSYLFDSSSRSCGSLQYCNFIHNFTNTSSAVELDPPAKVGDGLMMRAYKNDTENLYKWQTQNASEAMPFACVFRFSPMKALTAPTLPRNLTIPENYTKSASTSSSPSESSPANADSSTAAPPTTTTTPTTTTPVPGASSSSLTETIKNSSIYQVRYFPRWRTFSQAKSFCEQTTSTNAVGDIAAGELATAVNSAEFEYLSQVVLASRVHQLAPRDHADFGGAWIGLSNANTDTFATVSDLESNQLYWNQGTNSKLSYNSSVSWNLKYTDTTSGLMCNKSAVQQVSGNSSSLIFSSPACPTIRTTSSNTGTGHVGITFNGTVFTAINTALKRPFVCSYRFPYRVNITSYLTIEYISTPLPNFNDAKSFCDDRTLSTFDPNGNSFRATLGFLPRASMNDLRLFFAHSNPMTRSDIKTSVYVGGVAWNKCLVYSTNGSRIFYFDDCSQKLPFICQFSVSGSSHTLSKSASFENFTGTVTYGTHSLSFSEPTETKNRGLSPTVSFAESKSTKEATLSQSNSHNLTDSESQELTLTQSKDLTITPLPPPPPTPPPTTKAPQIAEGVDEVQTTASVIAVASGTGVVAVQQARLSLTKALASCGTGDELHEEPERLSSPLKIKFGGGRLQWHRGLVLGNFVMILIVAVSMVIVTKIYALLTAETMERAFLRTRMPGAMIIPVAILLPPTAQSVVVLFANKENGGDIVLGVFGLSAMVIFPIGCVCYLAYQVRTGVVTLYFNDHEEPTEWAKKHPEFAKTKFYRGFCWLTESIFEYRDTIPDDSEIEELMIKPDKEDTGICTSDGMKAFKAPLKSYKHHPAPLELLSQNKHFAYFGVVYEDFSRYQPPITDVVVSTILGLTSGAAMGLVPFAGCITCFVLNILAAGWHLFSCSYWRCINPRFLQYFTMAGTLLTFFGVILALAQYLVKTFDYDKAYSVLGLANGGLGLATAVMGFLGFFNFLYQLFDAYYLRTTEANLQATGVSKPENLDLINIEEELRKLEQEQEGGDKIDSNEILGINEDDGNEGTIHRHRQDTDDFGDLNTPTATNAKESTTALLASTTNNYNDLDRPLISTVPADDDSALNIGSDSSAVNRRGSSSASIIRLDDSITNSSNSMTDETMQKVKAGTRNEQLIMRQKELQEMLDKKKQNGGDSEFDETYLRRMLSSGNEFDPNFDEDV